MKLAWMIGCWLGCSLGIQAQSSATDSTSEAGRSSVWIEGEDADVTNFRPGAQSAEMHAGQAGASGGSYLAQEGIPGKSDSIPVVAKYTFKVIQQGDYNLWMACSSPSSNGGGWTSPLYLQVDDNPWKNLKDNSAGPPYGIAPKAFFVWIDAGTYTLSPGQHSLELQVRSPRSDGHFVAFIDSMFFTQDLGYRPKGDHPEPYAPGKSWVQTVKEQGFDKALQALEAVFYEHRLVMAHEREGGSEDEIIAKIMARPLPTSQIIDPGSHEFGVTTMEDPFFKAGVDVDKIQKAYELLARAGVQNLSTAACGWNRLGPDYNNFKELDYQVNSASKYGMTYLFAMGFAPNPYCVSTKGISAVKPEYHDKYSNYMETVLSRYKDKGVIQYLQLENEVDAPNPWWFDSTPEEYVEEVKLAKQAVQKIDPRIKVVAFAATYARTDTENDAPGEGRQFVQSAFDAGVGNYADAYSMHYTWALSEKDFPAFFRREEASHHLDPKPLFNTEETSYGRPSDVIKVFARDFYVYGMKLVEYFLARDFYEKGNGLLYAGLFDKDWKPKPRLLAYAAAVDAMKGRELVGMAVPATDVEAYVLQAVGTLKPGQTKYSIVLWRNSPDVAESIAPIIVAPLKGALTIKGLHANDVAMRWNLDPIKRTSSDGVDIDDQPIVIFSDQLPDWKLMSSQDWLNQAPLRQRKGEELVPKVQ
jgi:hypothetical protein